MTLTQYITIQIIHYLTETGLGAFQLVDYLEDI